MSEPHRVYVILEGHRAGWDWNTQFNGRVLAVVSNETAARTYVNSLQHTVGRVVRFEEWVVDGDPVPRPLVVQEAVREEDDGA